MAIPNGTNGASPTVPGGLSPDQLATFHRDGYLIIPSALAPSTVGSLLAETDSLLSSFSLADHPMTRFRTGGDDGRDHVGDAYFLESGDKVRFFFEEDAFDEASGRLARPKERAVNKIGHYLHGLSPPFAALLKPTLPPPTPSEEGNGNTVQPTPAGIARSLGFRDPRCLQSMVICKQPEIGGAVPPHQDSTFLYTDPPSAVGFWYALEDCHRGNGCLSFLPGSHRWAPITHRLVRKPGNVGTEIVLQAGSKFPPGEEYGSTPAKEGSGEGDEGYVMGEVKAGALVLIHGNLLHKSERNTSDQSRIIYTFHVIEGEGSEYDKKNWLQPPAQGFTRLYDVAT